MLYALRDPIAFLGKRNRAGDIISLGGAENRHRFAAMRGRGFLRPLTRRAQNARA